MRIIFLLCRYTFSLVVNQEAINW